MIIRKIYGLARNILHNSVSGWWAFNCPFRFFDLDVVSTEANNWKDKEENGKKSG